MGSTVTQETWDRLLVAVLAGAGAGAQVERCRCGMGQDVGIMRGLQHRDDRHSVCLGPMPMHVGRGIGGECKGDPALCSGQGTPGHSFTNLQPSLFLCSWTVATNAGCSNRQCKGLPTLCSSHSLTIVQHCPSLCPLNPCIHSYGQCKETSALRRSNQQPTNLQFSFSLRP